MKHLRHFCVTLVLVFALTGVALADDGIIHPWPPTPPTTTTTDSTNTENTVNDPTTTTQADDPVLDATLDLAQLVLGRL
jgi:hypothetical protein